MLALYAPGRFLNQTWWVCAAVRWIGKSEVTAPAKFVTGFLARLLKYPTHHTPTPHTALFYLPMYNPADGWYYIVKEGEHVTTSSDAATRRSSA
jgi:hypothetical protein